jgi:hypothetical protein
VDLYTLTDQFLSGEPVDEYVSAIWTERYFAKGDVRIVLPATEENMVKMADGTFLALRGTKEVMILETQSIEEGLLTVVGQTLPGFLDNRIAWFKNPAYDPPDNTDKIVDYSENDTTAGQFITSVVDKMIINPVPIPGADYVPEANLDWDFEVIPNLEIGAIDTFGAPERFTFPIGPIYSGIETLAKQEGLGFTLYLDHADIFTGYVLMFKTYRGVDRSTGGTHPLVRLTPDMDTLSGLKEVRSRANYKNVVYVWYKGELSVHYANPELPKPEGFDRRVLVIDAEGEPVGRKVVYAGFGPYGSGGWSKVVVGPAELTAFREQNAKDALANYNYIQAIDGETSPNNNYVYGVDYGLGDIIELEGITGAMSKARITEYIRSEDNTGERQYPTISVLGGE